MVNLYLVFTIFKMYSQIKVLHPTYHILINLFLSSLFLMHIFSFSCLLSFIPTSPFCFILTFVSALFIFTCPFIHAVIHSFNIPSTHSFIRICFHLLIYPFLLLLNYSSIITLIHLFMYPYFDSPIHPYLHSFTQYSLSLLTHPSFIVSIHSSIHLKTDQQSRDLVPAY